MKPKHLLTLMVAIITLILWNASGDKLNANPAGVDKIAPTTNTRTKPKLTFKNINDMSALSNTYFFDEEGNACKIGEPTAAESDIATVGYSKKGYRNNRITGEILPPANNPGRMKKLTNYDGTNRSGWTYKPYNEY